MASISPEILSDLIGCIYACALDPAAWPIALLRINQAAACHASVVGIVSFQEDFSLVNATAGFDGGFAQRYASNLAGLSAIWGGNQQIALRPVNEPVVLSLHHSDALKRGSAKHKLLCEVLGFEVDDTLNLPLGHFGRAIGAAGFARRSGQGPFGQDLHQLFRLLSPHIQRTADINRLLDAQTLSIALRDGLLERLRAPVAIVDGRMRVVQSNAKVENHTRRLTCDREIALAVNEVTRGGSPYRCVASGNSAGETQFIVHVMSLRDDPESSLSDYAALVLAPVRSVDDRSIEAVASYHGLTPAETSVLRHLVQGASSAEIASSLAVKTSTVRTHVLRIFEKFDVHHRAELVARLASFSSPFEPSLHQTVDAR